MYVVKYVENGEEKEMKFEERDEAFLFQSGLIAKRKRKENGAWDIEPKGVWNTRTIRCPRKRMGIRVRRRR